MVVNGESMTAIPRNCEVKYNGLNLRQLYNRSKSTTVSKERVYKNGVLLENSSAISKMETY